MKNYVCPHEPTKTVRQTLKAEKASIAK